MFNIFKLKKSTKNVPSAGEIQEALSQPNGYVYRIAPQYDANGQVPNYGVIGCWAVDVNGMITGEFVANPNYDLAKIKNCELSKSV